MLVIHLLILFLVGSFGLWMAVPVGLAYGFSPYTVAVTIILGSATSTFVVYILGNKVRRYVGDKRSERYLGRSKARMHQYLNKYGVIGLGLLMPGIFGPMLGMTIGISMVSATRRLLFWSMIGNVIWSIFLTGIGALGITVF